MGGDTIPKEQLGLYLWVSQSIMWQSIAIIVNRNKVANNKWKMKMHSLEPDRQAFLGERNKRSWQTCHCNYEHVFTVPQSRREIITGVLLIAVAFGNYYSIYLPPIYVGLYQNVSIPMTDSPPTWELHPSWTQPLGRGVLTETEDTLPSHMEHPERLRCCLSFLQEVFQHFLYLCENPPFIGKAR